LLMFQSLACYVFPPGLFMNQRFSLCLLCLFGLAMPAWAQVATPTPLLNEPLTQQPQRPAGEETQGLSPSHTKASPQLNKPLEDVSVDVTSYRIQGYDRLDLAAIQSLLQPYTGPGRSFEDLSNAARVVGAYLQGELGLYLAYAYLPAQSVSNGEVTIAVLPGVLEAIEVVWPAQLNVDREVIQAHLAHLKVGEVIHVSDVERVVFLLNDLRGLTMSFAVKPGTKEGAAILVANPKSDARLTGSLGLDANGSRFAGLYRGIATLNWESPMGLGDSLSVSHLQSETGGLDFTLLGYTLPVGANGLKLGVNVSQVNYRLNEDDFPLGLNGDAESVGVFALYPLVRSRNLNLFALLGHDHKTFTDRQSLSGLESNKTVDSVKVALSGDLRDRWMRGGLSFFNVGMEESKTHYANGRPFGLDDEAVALRVNYSLGRLQTLVPNRWMFWTYARGQHALDNLDSSDQCSLGGATGVRAFAQGEASGDSCTLFTAELRYLPKLAWFEQRGHGLSLNLFYDEGRVELRQDPTGRPAGFVNDRQLTGYGLGLSWEEAGEFVVNLSLAWEQAGVRQSDPKRQSPRLFASYTQYF
ncbi:MAG TPA: ShlB/FhaC/HecB family hemolysin secretion/activation protein, partial [Limnobacter sp.]|nr:ShlB/FhaC/HecB family hemolysin secretion/activation protein [Limnobacter sp.]